MPLSGQSSRREVERTEGAIEVFLVSPPKWSWLDHILLKRLNEYIVPNTWRLLVERDLCPFTISSRSYLKLCIAHVEACIVSFLVCSTSDLVLYFIQMYSANIYKWHKWVFHLGHLILPFLKNSIFTIKLFAFSVIHYSCLALAESILFCVTKKSLILLHALVKRINRPNLRSTPPEDTTLLYFLSF